MFDRVDARLLMIVFRPGEFTAPKGWPEDVGCAVIETPSGFPEIHPIHGSESGEEILERVNAKTDVNLADAWIYPEIEGRQCPDITFTRFREAATDFERVLSEVPDILEEALDFHINFEFAEDMGIPVNGLGGMADVSENGRTEGDDDHHLAGIDEMVEQTDPEPAHPAGYIPMSEPGAALPIGNSPPAMVRIDRAGEVTVLFGKSGWRRRETRNIRPLVRPDGMSVALPLADLVDGVDRPISARLPAGCFSAVAASPGRDIPADVTISGDHVIVTPVFWRDAPTPRSGGKWALLHAVLILAALAVIGFLTFQGPGEPSEDPVERIRDEIFRSSE